MKKAVFIAASLALLSLPALAQKGGGGVQQGGAAVGETVNAGTQGGMRATTRASKSSKSKKARRTKTR
jgi:hypothetical protein